MARGQKKNGNGKRLATQQSVDQAVKSICDIMRRGNCAGAMQYVPELTWILFLRILDENEQREEQEAAALSVPFPPSLHAPYRWRDWGAPAGWKRAELQSAAMGSFFNFVNADLLPHLKGLRKRPDATPRQKVISEIMTGVERVRIDTERNFLDVLDKVQELSAEAVDATHVFALSQVYEGLLLKMGEKGNDGGQFFTPRQVIKAMVQVIDPRIDETVYDPGCGTGGFLAQSFEHIASRLGNDAAAEQLETLKQRAFWGREKENLIYPIALANLVLHGIDKPNLWHGNTLTGMEIYGGLFEDAPPVFDVILTNPPFGGKEGKEAQTSFDYKTGATQVLFLQHVVRSLRPGGRCGIVLDEGLLFRANEDAFVKTKRKLLDDCDLWCVVSLPGGVFTAAGAGVKTNLLFFTKGQPDAQDLVLRSDRHQGGQEDAADAQALRGVLAPPAGAGRQRAFLDRGHGRAQAGRRRGGPAAQGAVDRQGPAGRAVERTAEGSEEGPATRRGSHCGSRSPGGGAGPRGAGSGRQGQGDRGRRLRPQGRQPAQETGCG